MAGKLRRCARCRQSSRDLQCDTDLPTGFRLGRVEVSCEGWSKPGDKMITQGEELLFQRSIANRLVL